MQRRTHAWSLALVALAIFCAPASRGRISMVRSIASLTAGAQVIVAGDVVKVEQVGVGETVDSAGNRYPAKKMAATIRVDDVLQGDVARAVIRVEYLQSESWEQGPETNALYETYALLFLQAEADHYGFSAPDSSWMRMSRNRAAVPRPPGPDAYTRVLQHLAAALFSLEDTSKDRITAIDGFQFEPSPIVTELFKRALDGPAAAVDTDLRLQLQAFLVGCKDTSLVPQVEAALFSSQDARYSHARLSMILALQNVDPATAAPILVRALKLPESELRRYAAIALKRTPGDIAIDGLLAALDDPDRDVQFQAMEALSYLVREFQWRPSAIQQDASWNRCLEHWREFAAARKKVSP